MSVVLWINQLVLGEQGFSVTANLYSPAIAKLPCILFKMILKIYNLMISLYGNIYIAIDLQILTK